jgi:Gamma interferon inducible lysosomal thiol reductase (GILT)
MKKISFLFLLLLIVLVISACANPLVKKEELTVNTENLVAYFINDSRCATPNCDATFTEGVKASLIQLFPSLEFVEYDYSSDLGGQFFEKYELTILPVILLTKKVETEENYSRLQNYLTPKSDLLDLKLGATFDPLTELHSVEFCDNQIDDNGDDLSDCADPMCAGNLVCREEVSNTLDLFVMSECPYGTKALDAMKEVLENFDDSVDFNVHFIASENPDGTFRSLHGQTEVDENARELCAIEYYPEDYEYMEYIWCRDTDLKADWSECAEDFPKVATCFENGEGYDLLKEDIKLANQLQIGASPTWIANNRYQFSGIDANTVKNNICQYNPGLGAACANELSTTAAPAGACN